MHAYFKQVTRSRWQEPCQHLCICVLLWVHMSTHDTDTPRHTQVDKIGHCTISLIYWYCLLWRKKLFLISVWFFLFEWNMTYACHRLHFISWSHCSFSVHVIQDKLCVLHPKRPIFIYIFASTYIFIYINVYLRTYVYIHTCIYTFVCMNMILIQVVYLGASACPLRVLVHIFCEETRMVFFPCIAALFLGYARRMPVQVFSVLAWIIELNFGFARPFVYVYMLISVSRHGTVRQCA